MIFQYLYRPIYNFVGHSEAQRNIRVEESVFSKIQEDIKKDVSTTIYIPIPTNVYFKNYALMRTAIRPNYKRLSIFAKVIQLTIHEDFVIMGARTPNYRRFHNSVIHGKSCVGLNFIDFEFDQNEQGALITSVKEYMWVAGSQTGVNCIHAKKLV